MKKYFFAFVLLSFGLTYSATAQEKVKLDNKTDSISYAYGLSIAKQLRSVMSQAGDDILDIDALKKGIDEGIAETPQLDENQIRQVMMAFQQEMQAAAKRKQKEAGAKNKLEGDKFLAANAGKPGVKVTPSGLQYKITKPGQGITPSATTKVEVHYEGRLLNGEVFDSSLARGKPSQFKLNQVIPGWTEGLQLMKPGAKYTFYIPANLAYGLRGSPPKIGANATLIFEVELIKIVK